MDVAQVQTRGCGKGSVRRGGREVVMDNRTVILLSHKKKKKVEGMPAPIASFKRVKMSESAPAGEGERKGRELSLSPASSFS